MIKLEMRAYSSNFIHYDAQIFKISNGVKFETVRI